MSEEKPPLEDWHIRIRPGVIGALIFMAVLIVGVVATSLYYAGHVEQKTHPDATTFPKPVLETTDTAPTDSPDMSTPAPPPEVAAAMRATAAEGDALWNSGQ
ncbi:MAG TPA: hypothetical protein VFL92_05775 [Sphingomonas sp.]|nr:hypothetical protein [Sphingomonas sp.]